MDGGERAHQCTETNTPDAPQSFKFSYANVDGHGTRSRKAPPPKLSQAVGRLGQWNIQQLLQAGGQLITASCISGRPPASIRKNSYSGRTRTPLAGACAASTVCAVGTGTGLRTGNLMRMKSFELASPDGGAEIDLPEATARYRLLSARGWERVMRLLLKERGALRSEPLGHSPACALWERM